MYATPEYYIGEYDGALISQDDLVRELENASEDINHMTFGRINGIGFESLYPRQQELIKKATCMQADYRKQYGPMLNNPMKGYSVGKTKVDLADITCGGISTTQDIINKLEDTGLRCRVL